MNKQSSVDDAPISIIIFRAVIMDYFFIHVSTGTHSSGLSVLPLINKRVSEVEKSL